jgi:hypothetical protein
MPQVIGRLSKDDPFVTFVASTFSGTPDSAASVRGEISNRSDLVSHRS